MARLAAFLPQMEAANADLQQVTTNTLHNLSSPSSFALHLFVVALPTRPTSSE
jgi:hypothetical protein